MKISELTPQINKTDNRLQPDSGRSARKEGQPGAAPVEVDTVKLSAASTDIKKMQAILETTPEVRAELVQAIKGQIERGEYQVDSRRVAEKMLQTFMAEGAAKE